MRLGLGLALPVALLLLLEVVQGVGEEEGQGEAVWEGEWEGEALVLLLCCGEPVTLCEAVWQALGETVPVAQWDGEPVGQVETLALALGEVDWEGVAQAVGDLLPLAQEVALAQSVGERVEESVGVEETQRVLETECDPQEVVERLGEAVELPLLQGVGDPEGQGEGVLLAQSVGERVGESVDEEETLRLPDCECDTQPVALRLGLELTLTEVQALPVLLCVSVTLTEGQRVTDSDGDCVAHVLALTLAVVVWQGLTVGDLLGVREGVLVAHCVGEIDGESVDEEEMLMLPDCE